MVFKHHSGRNATRWVGRGSSGQLVQQGTGPGKSGSWDKQGEFRVWGPGLSLKRLVVQQKGTHGLMLAFWYQHACTVGLQRQHAYCTGWTCLLYGVKGFFTIG